MRQYKVFEYPDGRIKYVKQGWSWPGFFFTWAWALSKHMWGIAVILFVSFFAIGGTFGVIDAYFSGAYGRNLTIFDPYDPKTLPKEKAQASNREPWEEILKPQSDTPLFDQIMKPSVLPRPPEPARPSSIATNVLIIIACIALSICVGLSGNAWRERNLKSRGYEYKTILNASNKEGAQALYIKEKQAQGNSDFLPPLSNPG